MTAEDYFAELTKLRAKYGRFNKKEGEDNVDWEKRLGEEYQSNANKIKTTVQLYRKLTGKQKKKIEIRLLE